MYSVTSKGMKYIDEYTINAGIPQAILMENAARAVLEEIERRFPDRATRVMVFAGPGNNGADAVCLFRWLLHKEYDARLYFMGDSASTCSGFREQMRILLGAFPEAPVYGMSGRIDEEALYSIYDVIVDGIFGNGLNRNLSDAYTRYVSYINSKQGYKIAIDIPTGLDATYGEIRGMVFEADLTVTFGAYKNGMLMSEGRDVCGEVAVKDIGLLKAAFSQLDDKLRVCDKAFLEESIGDAILPRREISHKGTYGTVGIVVSSEGMLGASILAAKAAYRAGCGLVKFFCPSKYIGFFNVSVPEAVVVPYKNDDVVGALGSFVKKLDCILIGPGLKEGAAERIIIKQLLASEHRIVFDAGAINLISNCMKSFRKRKCRCVLTPHLGEMARLVDEDINVVSKKRVAYTRLFSKKFNVSMVVKSDTSVFSLVGGSGYQNLYISNIGNSGLATAGSGDVQAGVIASLIAQGNSMNSALLYGSLIHASSSDRFAKDDNSKRRMMAGDIIENLF